MKIAYLLDDTLDTTDGVQQCVTTIGEEMRKQGHEVHYLVASTTRKDLTNVHSLAKFMSLKFNGNTVRTPLPVSSTKIKRLMSKLDIDVLHVQMPFSPFFAAKVIQSCGARVRIVGTWHTFPTGGLQKLSHIPLYIMIKNALRKVQVTIGVSQPTADFADSVYRTKSIIIPNAVDIARFRHMPVSTKKSLRKKIVFLGRFDERKGPIYLIEALGFLKTSDLLPANIDIRIGGKGPDLHKCIQRSLDLGLERQVVFPGFISELDKPAFLSSADVSVFPSTGGEAFGISVVEAMASGGSIVLAGDNPGYRSILSQKPELLFNPKDIPKFASILLHYINLTDPELIVKKKWLKESAEQYDVRTVCAQLTRVYLGR